MVRKLCTECDNTCLAQLGREVTVNEKTIVEIARLPLHELLQWIQDLDQHLSKDEQQVFAAFSVALKERTSHVIEVGLHYLTLDRTLPSLSAGESQRLRLASLLGSGLTGVLYVLDEPTTGLHPHDTAKLLHTLRMIQEAGNTVLVIEHDVDVIKNADYIIDIGPGGGSTGGEIVVAGTPTHVIACTASITGKYLAKKAAIRFSPPALKSEELIIRGAREHNLQNIDVHIPLRQFVVMAGVSGSGKSTLLFDILDKAARKHFNHARDIPGEHAAIEGLHYFNRVVMVDQGTIGNANSSRSNVATYTKLFEVLWYSYEPWQSRGS